MEYLYINTIFTYINSRFQTTSPRIYSFHPNYTTQRTLPNISQQHRVDAHCWQFRWGKGYMRDDNGRRHQDARPAAKIILMGMRDSHIYIYIYASQLRRKTHGRSKTLRYTIYIQFEGRSVMYLGDHL